MITTDNQKENDNFRIISERHSPENFITTCFEHDKRKNTATKKFCSVLEDISYFIEIKHFKFIKENVDCCGKDLSYILFNNGDICMLEIFFFSHAKKLKFLCNIANVIDINDIIQIEPYMCQSNSSNLVGVFILDINHRLFQIENKSIHLISSNVNLIDIYEDDIGRKIKFVLVITKHNKTAVYYYYGIVNKQFNYASYCINVYTLTLGDNVIDMNIHKNDVLFKYSNNVIKRFKLDNIGGGIHFIIGVNLGINCNFNKTKYYDDRGLKIDLLLKTIWGKLIIFQLVMCFKKKIKTYIPILIIQEILNYLPINTFSNVVSFVDD